MHVYTYIHALFLYFIKLNNEFHKIKQTSKLHEKDIADGKCQSVLDPMCMYVPLVVF